MWDGVNRRKFFRAEYPCLVTLRSTVQSPLSVLTHTEDISALGVNVIVTKKFDVLSEVDLELDLKDTLGALNLKSVVRWVKELPDENPERPMRYKTGIRFVTIADTQRHRIQNVVDQLQNRGS